MNNIQIKPWGYEQKISTEYSQGIPTLIVKKNLIVGAGHMLSLQIHKKRNEHWIIITGKGLITLDGDQWLAIEGTEWDIPPMTKHRIQAYEDMLIRETSYDYEEDDIIRLEDQYGRIK